MKNRSEAELPSVGDHLVSKRRLYTHHGIYIGDNRVVHYSGLAQGLQSGPIVISDMKEFLSGQPCQIRHYKEARFSPEEIKARAISRLGENLYHPLFNNCEHFAEWCISKRNKSRQVDFYLLLAGGVPGYVASKAGSGIATAIRKAKRWYKKR